MKIPARIAIALSLIALGCNADSAGPTAPRVVGESAFRRVQNPRPPAPRSFDGVWALKMRTLGSLSCSNTARIQIAKSDSGASATLSGTQTGRCSYGQGTIGNWGVGFTPTFFANPIVRGDSITFYDKPCGYRGVMNASRTGITGTVSCDVRNNYRSYSTRGSWSAVRSH